MRRPAIVIVTFKRQELLAQLFESIKKLTVPAWRVVVVDNENSPRTAQMAASFAAELAREIVHGRSFRALAFANHMENGRKVFWKMGRVVGVADGDSSADRCAQASWGHCDMRCRIRRLHYGLLTCRCP